MIPGYSTETEQPHQVQALCELAHVLYHLAE